MVIDSSKFLAEKGKLPSRILLGSHKNWVHFIQLILFRPSFVGRVLCSIILSYINTAHLLSQHPHYRHAERRVRLFRRDNQETIILKLTLSLLYIQFKAHWYNWTSERWPGWPGGCVQHVNELYFQMITALPGPGCQEKAHPSVGTTTSRAFLNIVSVTRGAVLLSRAHSDNQFQTDIKCGTLWLWPPLASPSQWR